MPARRPNRGIGELLRSKLGRSLLFAFGLCALAPLTVFGWLAFRQVTVELEAESDRTLQVTAKHAGMELASRLNWMVNRLEFACSLLRRGPEGERLLGDRAVRANLLVKFHSLSIYSGGRAHDILGEAKHLPELEPHELSHVRSGKWLVHVAHSRTSPQFEFVRLLESSANEETMVVAVAGPDQVLDREALRGSVTDITLFDSTAREVLTTAKAPPTDLLHTSLALEPTAGSLEWVANGESQSSRYWRVFLEPQYGQDWIVVQTVPTNTALAAVQYFRGTFLSVAVLALAVVLGLGLSRVRRVLEPVRHLLATTRSVRSGDLQARAELVGNDELAELGANFDQMTAELVENLHRREQTEKKLVSARDAALAAARSKAEFLTNVSHELRTPLTSISSAAHILSTFGEEDPSARAEFLQILVDESARLTSLIEGILELSTESDALPMRVSVADTIRKAIDDLPDPVRARVQANLSESSLEVIGDAGRLTRLWRSLLDNAAKFSDAGAPIVVRVAGTSTSCVVEVEDRGIGIPRDHLGRIFEPFHQGARDILTEKASGLGLGLSLARDIVQRHRGLIDVQSEPGAGSTFRVALPRAPRAVPAAV